MPYQWPEDTKFDHLTLDVEDKGCSACDHRHRRIFITVLMNLARSIPRQ
ncbi:unnamed protein product [marine sediment metagenome]|uniref:Uncharacterized protein n=1 Tax=marine sediment metagenome TaxID=412755 RepID=X1N2N2_9ZZZZ